VPTTITEANLGAWLIKCDPEAKFDLPRLIAETGLDVVTNWSVSPNYRSRMMRPGQKAMLWVSGNGRRMTRGIWGVGWVTGYVQDAVHQALQPGDDSYWHSEAERLAVTNDVALDIPLFRSGEELPATDLVAAGITDLEVQTQAQMSNPSWVSREQLAAIEDLLGVWPKYAEPDKRITVSSRGAGYGSSVQNQAVEEAAVKAVVAYYDGWRSIDRQRDRCGWDITFTHQGTGQMAHVEIKGVSGDRPTVLLTANELKAARTEENWHLAVVLRALTEPTVLEYTAEDALRAADPYVYRAELPAK
jgi:hypothetical protein